MAHIELVPTLATMAEVYRLPREGGPASPRFKRYLELIPSAYALAAYNPMAGPHALETIEQLIAVDAEAVAVEAASDVASLCKYPETITLVVVMCAPGAWTGRLATEIEHRTTKRPPAGHGMVMLWTREAPTREQIRREAMAEAVRVMTVAMRGRRESVASVLDREGLAYALSGNPYGPMTSEDEHAVRDAVEVLGTSDAISDMTAVLYGDEAAATLGWAPAGIREHGGYRWAINQAKQKIDDVGASSALRSLRSRR
jgi:hypothetical protein